MSYYFELVKDLNSSIVIVEHKDSYKFVTCSDKYTPSKIHNGENLSDVIHCYDIVNEKIIAIPLVEIMRYYNHDINDSDVNDSEYLRRANILRDKIKGYVAENTNVSFTQIYNSYVKTVFIDIYNIENTPVLDFLSSKKFALTHNDFVSPIVPEHRKQSIINLCKSIITSKLDEILSELNTIKQTSDDTEDIADIDTIIQMYEDTVNEIDYTSCKSLSDYFKVYPPLLLPLPKGVDTLLDKLEKIHRQSDDYVDFMNIVDHSLTYNEIQELLDELNTLQPTYNQESNEMDLTRFKEYLKYKLNNGHKQS
jgi:hypothetical protein